MNGNKKTQEEKQSNEIQSILAFIRSRLLYSESTEIRKDGVSRGD